MEIKKGIRFRKPPLVEALCEFRFQDSAILSNIILGKFYEKIEKDFPKIEVYAGIDVQGEDESGKKSPTHSIVVEETTRFMDEKQSRVIHVGPGLLIADQVSKYKDYPSFRSFVKNTMDIYNSIANPGKFKRICMRYINSIDIPRGKVLSEAFNIGFKIPEEFKKCPETYRLKMDFCYSDRRDMLTVVFEREAPKGDSPSAVMLNFDYVLAQPEKMCEDLLEWMDMAHESIEEAFHTCLTEETLISFEPQVPDLRDQ